MKFNNLVKSNIIALAILFCLSANAQQHNDFNFKRNQLQKRGMTVLTSWAGLNIGLGVMGSITHNDESKYFHQMNAGWNLVNLGLGISGLIQARRESIDELDLYQSLKAYRKTANAFLFNSALNISYITAGAFLLERSKNNPEDYHRLQGFGKSLFLQGGFLLLFDSVSFLLHRNNRVKKLDPFIKAISLSKQDIGFAIHF